MSRKRYTPEQIIRMLREAEVLISQGMTAAEAARQIPRAVSGQGRDLPTAAATATIFALCPVLSILILQYSIFIRQLTMPPASSPSPQAPSL